LICTTHSIAENRHGPQKIFCLNRFFALASFWSVPIQYTSPVVNEQIYANPIDVFLTWYEEAKCDAPIDPDTIALATATPEGRPSVRMVLFRGLREGGFSFFTNYQSRKGLELSENPFAAIVFYWAHLGKQVRIEGAVERVSPEASDTYFRQRPLLSQITANVSLQSRPMPDEGEFLKRLEEVEES